MVKTKKPCASRIVVYDKGQRFEYQLDKDGRNINKNLKYSSKAVVWDLIKDENYITLAQDFNRTDYPLSPTPGPIIKHIAINNHNFVLDEEWFNQEVDIDEISSLQIIGSNPLEDLFGIESID